MSLLHYQILNNNNLNPMILLHTTPLDLNYLKNSFKDILIDRRLVFIDLPGHGESKVDNLADITFDTIVEDIHDVINSLEIENFHLFGHGVGGIIAQHYAKKYERSLKSLTLSNTSPNGKYRELMGWNIRQRYSNLIKEAMEQYRGKTDDKSIRARFTQAFSVYFKPTNHDEAEKLMDNTSKIASEAYIYYAQHLIPKHNYREELRQFKVKTIIVGCTNDVWPIESVRLIKNDIPAAKFIVLEMGHFPMIENSKYYWDQILINQE